MHFIFIYFLSADPCIKNPCHNGATCHRIEDKYECICADASRPSHCSPGRYHEITLGGRSKQAVSPSHENLVSAQAFFF